MTTIGRLKAIRRELDMNQADFANGAGLSYGFYTQLEQGIKNITDKTIRKICGAYSVNEKWLRNGEGRMFVDTRLDAFEQFAAAFNLSTAQQRQVADIIQFPLDRLGAPSNDSLLTAKRNVARLVKAIDHGSIGRVMSVETAAP